MKRTFKVTQVNIQRILDELRILKDDQVKNQSIVDQSRGIVRIAENEINDKQRQLDTIKNEIERYNQDIVELENRYRDTIYLHEGARDRLGGLHRMHVKLLATR